MAYTQAQLNAIKEAFASGTLTVDYDGKRVTYRSLREMKEIIATIEAELAGTGQDKRPVAGFVRFSRG